MYVSGLIVRQSSRDVLNEASISQFFTRFWTRDASEVAGWDVVFAAEVSLDVTYLSPWLMDLEAKRRQTDFFRKTRGSWYNRGFCRSASWQPCR